MIDPQQAMSLCREVLEDLQERPPRLNPKWFYDDRGSTLFDAITRQPEYYPTRTEEAMISQQGEDIGRWVGPGAQLVELGAGNGEKAVMLLRHLENPSLYVPVDISSASLEISVNRIRRTFPTLAIEPVACDFSEGLPWPSDMHPQRRCLIFFGSTIGNMEPHEAEHWLARMRKALDAGERFLIGVDLKKDPAILDRAYNDAAGVTAEFNRNALRHLNEALGTTFDVDMWQHEASYNPQRGRVEMYLVATRTERVRICGELLTFYSGDRIHTESSYKYHIDEFMKMARHAGYETDWVWTDDSGWFSLHGLRAI